jgi:glycosyltransferase involved in cell wall biosynthesis
LSYWVAVVARNAAYNISSTLNSLLNQTQLPSRIVVVNDGSSDKTSEILTRQSREHPTIQVLDRPDRGYDIRRVPSNINLAIASTSDLQTEYLMISGDDCTYPTDYVASLTNRMRKDTRIAVASGRPNQVGLMSQEHSPSGSGRVVRTSFLRDVGSRFPIRAGWEAWLLFKAAQKGLKTNLFSDLVYAHVRPRGIGHQFTYWGAAMYTLGYHPLYASGRIARNLIKLTSLKSSTALLRGYMTAALGSSDPLAAAFDPSLRKFVSEQQSREIARIVVSVITHGIG